MATTNYMAGNHCYGCGAPISATDYLSHPRTDCRGDDGKAWHDAAICLCLACYEATEHMVSVTQFLDWRATNHPPKPPAPKYLPGSLVYAPEGDSDGERIGTDHFVLTTGDDWEEVACAPDEELGRLFAAAPDLLAVAVLARETAITILGEVHSGNTEPGVRETLRQWAQDLFEKATAAIAKTEGAK